MHTGWCTPEHCVPSSKSGRLSQPACSARQCCHGDSSTLYAVRASTWVCRALPGPRECSGPHPGPHCAWRGCAPCATTAPAWVGAWPVPPPPCWPPWQWKSTRWTNLGRWEHSSRSWLSHLATRSCLQPALHLVRMTTITVG